MTASRYAVSIKLNAWEAQEMLYDPEYLGNIKARMRRDLGDVITKVIDEEIKKPTIVRLEWNRGDIVFDESYRLSLVAQLMPTEIMQVRLAEFSPMEFSYSSPDSKVIPVEWQCAYCGQTNLVKSHLDCRKCGAPRAPIL